MSEDPWHEEPAFWGTLEGLLFPPEKLDDAADELDALLSLADVDGVAADAAGYVQHTPALDARERQQRVQFVGGGVEFLRREQ